MEEDFASLAPVVQVTIIVCVTAFMIAFWYFITKDR